MRLSWLFYLPSITGSALLFCLIGAPFGAFVFLKGMAIAQGHPLPFSEFEVGAWSTLIGAVPAFVTGLAAGILRIHVRSLLLLAFIMAPVGALMTAIYLVVFMTWLDSGLPWIDRIILVGGVSAFCCTFLLWRNRPWTIADRPRPRAESDGSLRLRFRRMRSFWAGWEP